MGKMKKLMALLACTAMVAGSIAGCGSSSDTSAPAPAEPAVSEPAGESAEVGSEAAQGDSQVVSEESGTLRMYGPGLVAAVGENGTTDRLIPMLHWKLNQSRGITGRQLFRQQLCQEIMIS